MGVAQLVIEGLLIATGTGMPFHQLTGHPALFPFSIRLDATQLRRKGRLRVHRQGDQTDFIEVVETRPTAVPGQAKVKEPRSRKRQQGGDQRELPL